MFDVEASVERTLQGLDRERILKRFQADDEFVFLEKALDPGLVSELVGEVRMLQQGGFVNRSWIPGYKKGGSVSYFSVREKAPIMLALYRSAAFRGLMSHLTGRPMYLCPENDPHSCALFLYNKPGDRVGFHFDSCHYKKGIVYTVLLGLINQSKAHLCCHLYTERKDRQKVELKLSTEPGSMVIFNGCNVYHGTTPLAKDEERVVFSMEFLLHPYMSPTRRLIANIDHAIRYFGVSSLFRNKRA